MKGIRRWLRKARRAAVRLRQQPASAKLRGEIVAAISQVAAAQPSPYYDCLANAARNTADLRLIGEVLRTLRATTRLPQNAAHVGSLVSVIMPVRDRAGVVANAIGSALAQSHRDLELLICDDASTDATWRVLEGFGDPRIRRFRLPDHRGAAPARNLCLAEARGDLIAYLDSDNLWHPRYLAFCVEALRTEPNRQTAFASYFDLQLDSRGRATVIDAAIRPFDLEAQIEKPFVDLNSFLHRRILFHRFGGFDERLVRRQDYDLIVRYCWLHPPAHIPYALNLYRRAAHLAQITQVHGGDEASPAIIRDKIAAYRRHGVPERA